MILRGWIAKDFEGTVWFSRYKPKMDSLCWNLAVRFYFGEMDETEDCICLGKRTGISIKPNTCRRVTLRVEEEK